MLAYNKFRAVVVPKGLLCLLIYLRHRILMPLVLHPRISVHTEYIRFYIHSDDVVITEGRHLDKSTEGVSFYLHTWHLKVWRRCFYRYLRVMVKKFVSSVFDISIFSLSLNRKIMHWLNNGEMCKGRKTGWYDTNRYLDIIQMFDYEALFWEPFILLADFSIAR